MGEYAAKNFPTGSIILGEQLSRFEVLDMSYYSQGKVQGNLVVYEDVWWPLKQIKAEELSQFLQDDSNYTEKYYLIQENIRGALFRSTQVSPEDFELVTRFNVHSRIILIDPFYLMVPRDLPYFWGTMDISYFLGLNVIKIYPVGAGPFHSEFSGWYSIYKYTGKTAEGVKQAIDDYLEE